jgi:tyrosyl-tRNA synthetase
MTLLRPASPTTTPRRSYTAIEDLVADYSSGALHPGDLKPALSRALNLILQPVRDHFENDPTAKELLKQVKAYKVTR